MRIESKSSLDFLHVKETNFIAEKWLHAQLHVQTNKETWNEHDKHPMSTTSKPFQKIEINSTTLTQVGM